MTDKNTKPLGICAPQTRQEEQQKQTEIPGINQQRSIDDEKHFNNLIDLTKYCLQQTPENETPNTSELEKNDEKRKWLRHVVENLTVDYTKSIIENFAKVKLASDKIDQNEQLTQSDIETTQDALSQLLAICDEVDFVQEIVRVNGLLILIPILRTNYDNLRIIVCEIFASISENNPRCQEFLLNARLIEELIPILKQELNVKNIVVKTKALYALSSLIRSNDIAVKHFDENINGFPVLIDLLNEGHRFTATEEKTQTDIKKLNTKITFLISTLVCLSEEAKKKLLELNLVPSFKRILKETENEQVRENIMITLEQLKSESQSES